MTQPEHLSHDESADLEPVYGARAGALLRDLHAQACTASAGLVDDFYDSLMRRPASRRILERLDDFEFTHLREQQARHLATLVSPSLEAGAHRERALQVGRIHALVGVDMTWLTQAYGLYQEALHRLLERQAECTADLRRSLVQLVDRRLLFDLQAQSVGYRQVEQELARAAALLQRHALVGSKLNDFYQGCLRALCGLEGLAAAFVGRLDASGRWEVEAYGGASAPACLAAAQVAQAPLLHEAAEEPQAPTILARAWREGSVCTCNSSRAAREQDAWIGVTASLGLRSCAVVPLADDSGHGHALLILHSRWPGFFDAGGRGAFLEQVRQIVGSTARRLARPGGISYSRRNTYGAWLESGRVRMLYQPIIDLRSGVLTKVEALARLVGDDSGMVAPDEFLPALESDGLLRLFECGLDIASADQRAWHDAGLHVRVALNLPPQAVGDERYHEVLFRTLDGSGLDPRGLELEIPDNGDAQAQGTRQPFVESLRERGVRVVHEDLGCGPRSLLRPDHLPFDELKIDQALVREAARKDPQRAFAFILHLTHLSNSLNMSLTVGGLEHPGLVEAAAILGADRGQGYGIAKPMPAHSVPGWIDHYRHAIDPREPVTPWGALAGYLIRERQLGSLSHWPEVIDGLVRAPCPVQRFLDARGMRDSGLQRVLDINRSAALHPASASLYRSTRAEIIQALCQLGGRAPVP